MAKIELKCTLCICGIHYNELWMTSSDINADTVGSRYVRGNSHGLCRYLGI